MPSSSKNGKPRIAVVSDRSDQLLQDLVLGLRDAGAFVDILKDVYTAMRGLAGGATLDRVLVDVRTLDQEELRFLKLAPRYFSGVEFSVPLLQGTKDRLGTRVDRFHCVGVDTLLAEVAGAPMLADGAAIEDADDEVATAESAFIEARHEGDVSLQDRVVPEPVEPDRLVEAEPSTQIDRLVASSEPIPPVADETAVDEEAFVAEPLTEAEAIEARAAEEAIESPADAAGEVADEIRAGPLETGEPLFEPPPSEPWEWRPAEEADIAEPIAPRDVEAGYTVPLESVEHSEVPPAEDEIGELADASWEDAVAEAYEDAADAQMEAAPPDDEPDAVELEADDEVTFDADLPPIDEDGADQAADSSWAEPFEDMPAEPLYEEPRETARPLERRPLSTDGGLDAVEEGPSLHEAVRRRMAGDDPRFVLRRRPPGGRVAPSADAPCSEPPAGDVVLPDPARDGGFVDAGPSADDALFGNESTASEMPEIGNEDASALSSEEMDALLRDELTNGETPTDSDTTDARDGGVA